MQTNRNVALSLFEQIDQFLRMQVASVHIYLGYIQQTIAFKLSQRVGFMIKIWFDYNMINEESMHQL